MRRLLTLVIGCVFVHSALAQEPSARLFAPGSVSTGAYELNAVISPDGQELYYTMSTPDPGFDLMTIVVSQRNAQGWSEPEVASFSGRYSDVDPYLAPDGKRMFFISKRPHPDSSTAAAKSDFDVWYVDRDGEWTPAANLGDAVNTASREYCPMVTPDGETLYFTSDRSIVNDAGDEPLTYAELREILESPGNGLGDVYSISLDDLGVHVEGASGSN